MDFAASPLCEVHALLEVRLRGRLQLAGDHQLLSPVLADALEHRHPQLSGRLVPLHESMLGQHHQVWKRPIRQRPGRLAHGLDRFQ